MHTVEQAAAFRAGSCPELFHLATGSHSALYLYRVSHLVIYPFVLLVPTERTGCPFPIDFW